MSIYNFSLVPQLTGMASAGQAANLLAQAQEPECLLGASKAIKEGLRGVDQERVRDISHQMILFRLAQLDAQQEAMAKAKQDLVKLVGGLPEGMWEKARASEGLKRFIDPLEFKVLVASAARFGPDAANWVQGRDPVAGINGTIDAAAEAFQKRVEELQTFGIPNAADVARVEQNLGFQLNLDSKAIEVRAKELEGLFYRVQLPIPQAYYDLPESAQEALVIIGKAIKLLDPPYRIMSNPFGEVFEEMIMGTPAFASLRPYYIRFAGVFDFLRPRGHTAHGFLPGMENVARPKGGNLYPLDITNEDEFHQLVPKGSPLDLEYRVLFRRDPTKGLIAIPYSEAFAKWLGPAADLLEEATNLLEKDFPQIEGYLRTVVNAFRTNDFVNSDRAWVQLTEEGMDMNIGAIEEYMDQVRGALAQLTGVLQIRVNDPEFEETIRKLKEAFPKFEELLPVEEEFKKPPDQRKSRRVSVLDEIFAAAENNSGAIKPSAFNRPNDAKVRSDPEAGFRICIENNILQSRFKGPVHEKLLKLAIDPDQQHLITFNGSRYYIIFHELGHGHGVEYVVGSNPPIPIWHALGEYGLPSEELRADFVGLYNAHKAFQMGLISQELRDQIYVSYVFRCIGTLRRGTAGAHARAALIALNFLSEQDVIFIDEDTGNTYVDLVRMPSAAKLLAGYLTKVRGLGRKNEMGDFFNRFGTDVPYGLEEIYKALKDLPVDIIAEFEFEKLLEDHPQSRESRE